MKYYTLLVVMLFGITTSFASNRKDREIAQSDSLIVKRQWSFRPITMQNPTSGTTRDIFDYNFYLNLNDSLATLSMPVEWVSMSIYTEQFTTTVQDYSASFIDNDYWRVLFTLQHTPYTWAVEVVIEPSTGRAQTAIVAPEGTMRYIGALYNLKNREK